MSCVCGCADGAAVARHHTSRQRASPPPANNQEPSPPLAALPHHTHSAPPLGMWLQNVLSRIARVEYEIPKTMSPELQDLLG